jgi:hypothetical protein
MNGAFLEAPVERPGFSLHLCAIVRCSPKARTPPESERGGVSRTPIDDCEFMRAPLGQTRGRAKNSLDGKSGTNCAIVSLRAAKKAPLEAGLRVLGDSRASIVHRRHRRPVGDLSINRAIGRVIQLLQNAAVLDIAV